MTTIRSHHHSLRVWILALFVATFIAYSLPASAQDQWVRPQNPDSPLIWGRKDGVLFGIPSEGGMPGPRGLIRIGVLSPTTHQPQLLNFVAVEPVTFGAGTRFSRMAFSELEMSTLDPGKRGKRLTVHDANAGNIGGSLTTVGNGTKPIERLSVRIDVERFTKNGAHVYVVASIDSDHPDEVRFEVHHEQDSPPIEELTLTATMGNFERLRWLFLKDQVLESKQVFAGDTGDDFYEHENFPLDEMLRNADGDAIVLSTSNEAVPSSAPDTNTASWHYPLPRLTQYWRVPAHDLQPDLRVRVNGRRVYWQSHNALPNGVAFENFEVRERYEPGQTFIFGVTPREPWQFSPAIPHLKQPDLSTEVPQQSEKR